MKWTCRYCGQQSTDRREFCEHLVTHIAPTWEAMQAVSQARARRREEEPDEAEVEA